MMMMDRLLSGSAAIRSAVTQFTAKRSERPKLCGDLPAWTHIGLSDEGRGNVVEIVQERLPPL
ncbi:hypothetical protein DTW92_15540 [Paracoccus pantotrophus]|nr:hypothetical protein DTW92_15540 [Paracoccus pantotrophus]